jgi:antitoxin MazE
MRGQISRWGNSLGVRIPKDVASRVGFTEGARVEIEVSDGHVVISRSKPRYKLADLLKGMTPHDLREASREADFGPDVGREIID